MRTDGKPRNKTEAACLENVAALRGYAQWEGKTPAERELIGAIRLSVERSMDALGGKPGRLIPGSIREWPLATECARPRRRVA